jgi:hypothetical protein
MFLLLNLNVAPKVEVKNKEFIVRKLMLAGSLEIHFI